MMKTAEPPMATESEFRVEFSVRLRYSKGTTRFQREERLPFVPFIGLDDVLGEFNLKRVAWHSPTRMFLCQSSCDRHYWTLQKAKRSMKKAGWEEDLEARCPSEQNDHEEFD